MAGGPNVTGGFSQALDPSYRKVFFDEYTRIAEEYSKVANISSGDMNFIKEGQMSGFGAMKETGQGEPMFFDRMVQGNEKTVYYKAFTLGFTIPEELYEDDLTGHFKKIPAELGKSAAYTKELEFWDIFNNGFVTTYRTGIDGKALFADDHPTLDADGATQDNEGTAAALSQTSLQAALDHFENLENERGIPIVKKPKYLIIPPALRWKAKELLLTEAKPYTADNTVNALYDEGLQYMVCHYLTSDTAWFLVTEPSEHDLRFVWRKKTAFNSWDDPSSRMAFFGASNRFVTTFFDWRGTYGNLGA